MDIVFSANNNKEVYILPVVPSNLDPLNNPRKNEEFETINNGTINLIGNKGLRTISIQSFFPTKNYPWIKKGAISDGWQYVNFFNKWTEKRVPIRIIIITNNGVEMLNMACTVENFPYGIDRTGDILYTLELKEYPFVQVKKV